MTFMLDLVSWVFILTGVLFMMIGVIGILRMPDFYTRLHAAGMTDTMGAAFILAGLMLQGGWTSTPVRLALILLFIYFTSAIATHALANAAFRAGLRPRLSQEEENTSSNL